MGDATREASLGDGRAWCVEPDGSSDASASRTLPSIDLAIAFLQARGVTLLVEVSSDDVAAFVASRLASGC